jgi:hypothetical protein
MKKTSFQLNPTATEFVPSFVMNSSSSANNNSNNTYKQSSYNNSNQRYQNSHYNNYNNYNYHNNHNYHHNRSNNNHFRNNNYHYHSNQHHQSNNYYHNNNYYYNNHNNSNDVDPIELEARVKYFLKSFFKKYSKLNFIQIFIKCEAVIEILQDDQIRDQLNPVSRFQENRNENNNSDEQNESNEPGLDDEEDLEEMLAMQEECRLEMMKFYIQSQNPNLFEELYHDVSYPEGVKKDEKTSNNNENTQASDTTSDSEKYSSKDLKEYVNSKSEESIVQEKLSNLELNDENKS